MKILQISFNGAKTFINKMYGVSKYTLSTYSLFKRIGDAILYIIAPPIFYSRGRPQESYFRLWDAGKSVGLNDRVYIKFLGVRDFLKYILYFLKYQEFYTPLYYLHGDDIESLIYQYDPDVLVFEFFSFINLIGEFKGMKIYRPHEVYALYRGFHKEVLLQEAKALNESDLILVPSKLDREHFIRLYSIDEDKIEVLPLPIEKIHHEIVKSRSFDDKDHINAIFSGFPHKHNIDALKFITKVADKTPFVTYHIYGSFPKKKFEKRKNVVFHGFVPWKDYIRALIEADVAVMPLEHTSGINVRVAEYISYGLPIIGTPYIGRGYDLMPKKHFLSFNNLKEYIKCVDLARDGNIRKKIINEAIKYAEDNLSVENLARRLSMFISR